MAAGSERCTVIVRRTVAVHATNMQAGDDERRARGRGRGRMDSHRHGPPPRRSRRAANGAAGPARCCGPVKASCRPRSRSRTPRASRRSRCATSPSTSASADDALRVRLLKEVLLDATFESLMGELPLPTSRCRRTCATPLAAIAPGARARSRWPPRISSSLGQRSEFGPNSTRHVEQSLAGGQQPRRARAGGVHRLARSTITRSGTPSAQVGMQAVLRREGLDQDEWRQAMEPTGPP